MHKILAVLRFNAWQRILLLSVVLLPLSLLLLRYPDRTVKVTAIGETQPVSGRGDAADDPAVWIHPTEPGLSTIIGTDKKTPGLAVYDLKGRQIQFVEMPSANNVDLRDGFEIDGAVVTLVVVTNPAENALQTFRVDPSSRELRPLKALNNRSKIKPGGVCMYKSAKTGQYYVFSIWKQGHVEQWQISSAPGETVRLTRLRDFALGSKAEACVVDDALGVLYVSEEEVGIWRINAEPDHHREDRLIDYVGRGSGHLVSDVEGLAIYDTGQDRGYLIASSQGNDSFAIYDRVSNRYMGQFRVGNGAVDGISNTDGIEVTNHSLGGTFPNGLFVAQDGSNRDSYGRKKRQNFKLVPWDAIARGFRPPLQINAQQ
jgi:3-phytase